MTKIQKIRITAIVKNKDKILLLRQASKIGVWEFPAGSMKFGETPEQTAKRELEEETRLKATSKGLFAINSCVWKSYEDEVHEIVIAYLFETNEKHVDIFKNKDHEHLEYKWVSISELNEMFDLAFTVKCILNMINKQLNFTK